MPLPRLSITREGHLPYFRSSRMKDFRESNLHSHECPLKRELRIVIAYRTFPCQNSLRFESYRYSLRTGSAMHCPSCGQKQVSNETKFCSRCGMPLGIVSDVLAHGFFLPQLAE